MAARKAVGAWRRNALGEVDGAAGEDEDISQYRSIVQQVDCFLFFALEYDNAFPAKLKTFVLSFADRNYARFFFSVWGKMDI